MSSAGLTAPPLAPPPGRRIAVVGGSGGIGQAVVAQLLAAGCRTAVLDLLDTLKASALPDHVLTHALDVTDEDSVQQGFAQVEEEFGGLDGLVNLAGFAAARQSVRDTSLAVWREVVDVNLQGTFLSCRAALPLLARGQEAAIVNVASGLAVKPTRGYGPYSAAKAGVLSLTRLIAQENAPAIRANAVAPSAVATPFLRGGTGRDPSGQRFDAEAYAETVPLGRIAVPDDVVGPILFFLGPASAYVTGQTLHVNGGLLMT